MDVAVPTHNRVKLKESEKRDKYLDLAREIKKTMKHKSYGDTNCNLRAKYSPGDLRGLSVSQTPVRIHQLMAD